MNKVVQTPVHVRNGFKEGNKTYQSMVRHMRAVRLATTSDPLRYRAKGRQPNRARKMQMGISIARAIDAETSAGHTMSLSTVSCRLLVGSSGQRISLKTSFRVARTLLDAVPIRCLHWPHACPTKAKDVASSACTGTMTRPHRMVLKTPHAVA